MLGYVTTADFKYARDRTGKSYGWGIARYATPEQLFGKDFTDQVYAREPEESKNRILSWLQELLPDASEKELNRIIV